MLKRFVAENLNDRVSCEFNFADDLNIVTGRNGSGKTTVLKVIWYLLSANIERIPPEMSFDYLLLETERFEISIRRDENNYELMYRYGSISNRATVTRDNIVREAPPVREANHLLGRLHSSIFFPTFRRIEGGFSMGDNARSLDEDIQPSMQTPRGDVWLSGRVFGEAAEVIQRGFGELSRRLSTFNHTFVSSISTIDIVSLLTTKYASISETTNRTHKELSEQIFSLIGKYDELSGNRQSVQLVHATSTLTDIKGIVNRFNEFSDNILKPVSTLSDLVKRIFQDKGINVSENIVLGDVQHAINSQILSSGEKHMLSFLSYNAFSDNTTIFIDEPEISLHVDWQRILFPTLLHQGTNNQFVIATHSPFIYTKYPERELVLNPDRGGELDAGS